MNYLLPNSQQLNSNYTRIIHVSALLKDTIFSMPVEITCTSIRAEI